MTKSPIIKIAKKVCPAVITILASKDIPKVEGFYFLPIEGKEYIMPKFEDKKEKTNIGGGSGFIVSKDGYILTNQHVVSDSNAEYTVILEPTKQYKAKVVSRDPIYDIAILKIKGNNFPFLKLGDSDKIELGESVIAVGNALGEFHDTISAGIISGMSRAITAYYPFSNEKSQLRGLIQTDAAINPGNSGGPLINMKGEVIGINTAHITGAQNIGFAIPINYAKKDLKEVLKYGEIRRPFLGVRYIILNQEISKHHNLPVNYGALLVRQIFGGSAVVENSSAQKAGLKEYDIILEINGQKITEENPLGNQLQNYKIGQKIKLKILRENKEMIIDVILEKKK